MYKPEWVGPPEESTGDKVHALVKATLSAATFGVAGDLFAVLCRTPYERRLREWIDRTEQRLARLARRDNRFLEKLAYDETFASVLLSATQAAVRTHSEAKLAALAAAVENSATGISITADLQLLFIRFLDELTPSHLALLGTLKQHEEAASKLQEYEALRRLYVKVTDDRLSDEEFKLLCNDLSSRVLARFSDALEDFGGIAERSLIVSTSTLDGPTVIVTELGRRMLAFVCEQAAGAAS